MKNVGYGGYSWSATAVPPHSQYLAAEPNMFNPSHTSSRAHGLQLRCLSE
ncbi:hypothetical protein [uncultured Rikenella sp.]|nr:hypothetical protein [uncultured Rikenella sp.]